MSFDLLTQNVNQYMLPGRGPKDIRKAANFGDVIMWQEIAPTSFKAEVARLNERGFDSAHLTTQIPISWKRKGWELVDKGVVTTHKGRKGVSPHRQISWVVLRRKANGLCYVFVNTHFVSGAWNAKRLTGKAWRKVMWEKHYAALHATLRPFIAADLPIFLGGDFNRVKKVILGDRIEGTKVTYLTRGGIDYLIYIAGNPNLQLVLGDVGSLKGQFTDHAGRIARVGLRKIRHRQH